ncbi:hypothetical protein [Streptomyces lavendulocolor]|uniref:hypothetical protein n=1 Tax=Streptomyces lavendulocolor TaxID=67316 RepID=UPI0033D72496
MPENTITAPLAPMEPQDITDAFAYIRAWQADDTACAVIDGMGPEALRMLLDVAARIVIPITAVDEPCAHSFLAAALGRLLLELLSDGACLSGAAGIAQTIVRFSENILTEDPRRLRRRPAPAGGRGGAAGDESAPGAPNHRVTAPRGRRWCGTARIPGAPPHHRGAHHRTYRTTAPPHVPPGAGRRRCGPPASPHRAPAGRTPLSHTPLTAT